MLISEVWNSGKSDVWDNALTRYWCYVLPKNVEIEKSLDSLSLSRIASLNADSWYKFLLKEYFRWKYTAANRYASTTKHLKKSVEFGKLEELNRIRQRLLDFDVNDIGLGLWIAGQIPGLGVAGASGLLSIMYPEHFGTVDQFVVKALREVDKPESVSVLKMNPEDLKSDDEFFSSRYCGVRLLS